MTIIGSLSVRIKTKNRFGAGTDNDVYFDIGPLGWKLGSPRDDFERGSDDTYQLDLPSSISSDDIVWLQLQKKGIGGVVGTTDLPDGEWLPESIHLLVNGKEFLSYDINQWLVNNWSDLKGSVGHWSWRRIVDQYAGLTPSELFVRTLRLRANDPLTPGDEDAAALFTNFKYLGFSGWIDLSLPVTCAVGTLIREPARSADGLATIDIALEGVDVGNTRYILDGRHGISGGRFVRVEYLFRKPWPNASGEQSVPHAGERVKIGGKVKWDTDQEGWYEIHPRGNFDVQVLPHRAIFRNFASSFVETVGNPEDCYYDWPGCQLKNAAPGMEPRRFHGQRFRKHQMYQLEADIAFFTPKTVLQWSIDGNGLQEGSGAVQVGGGQVGYVLNGRALKLWNRPDDGTYSFGVTVQCADYFQPSSGSMTIAFDGIHTEWEPDYYRLISLCDALQYLQTADFRTIPEEVPLYDPFQLVQMKSEVLGELIREIVEKQSLPASLAISSQFASNVELVQTIGRLAVRYPRVVAAALGRQPALADLLKQSGVE